MHCVHSQTATHQQAKDSPPLPLHCTKKMNLRSALWLIVHYVLFLQIGDALVVAGRQQAPKGVSRPPRLGSKSKLAPAGAQLSGRLSSALEASAIALDESPPKSAWPSNDALDRRILALAVPAILNFAILPLVGAVDTFFVGRMKEALALAGQSASNQV